MGKKLSQQKNYDSPPKSSKENIKKDGRRFGTKVKTNESVD